MVYSNIHHNIFGFSSSGSKLQKQMPASKKTASNDALDVHDVPEASIVTDSSDNDAEVENDEKHYETETETETDCTTESDDEDNNDNHPRYIFFPYKTLIYFCYCVIGLPLLILIAWVFLSLFTLQTYSYWYKPTNRAQAHCVLISVVAAIQVLPHLQNGQSCSGGQASWYRSSSNNNLLQS